MDALPSAPRPSVSIPQSLLSPSIEENMDRLFIYYMGLRLLEFRHILPKEFHVSCNVLIAEIQQYLGFRQGDEIFLTISESRTAKQHLNSVDLRPTSYTRNLPGRGGTIDLDFLCLLHSVLSTICTPSSDIQNASSFLFIV